MSFRARLTLVAAAAVALAVVVASAVVYIVVRSELRARVDNDLRNRAAGLALPADTLADLRALGDKLGVAASF